MDTVVNDRVNYLGGSGSIDYIFILVTENKEGENVYLRVTGGSG